MRKLRVGKGKAMVTIEGALAHRLDKEIRALLGPVATEMQREADAILRGARALWPVRTGKSRDGWESSLRVHPGELKVEIFLTNAVAYVPYIISNKVGKTKDATRGRVPFQAHVRKPARASEKTLSQRLPALLGAHLQEQLRGR